jgi:glycerol-3-phosphate dehydrogenase
MAEDTLDKCIAAGLISTSNICTTSNHPLVGAEGVTTGDLINDASLALYGNESPIVSALPGNTNQLADGLTESMIRFGIRYEGAMTIEDILARRSRLLFLDANKALKIANEVANILEDEIGDSYNRHQDLADFTITAQKYLPIKGNPEESSSSTKVA